MYRNPPRRREPPSSQLPVGDAADRAVEVDNDSQCQCGWRLVGGGGGCADAVVSAIAAAVGGATAAAVVGAAAAAVSATAAAAVCAAAAGWRLL